jgi:hypothetical protein
VLYFPSQPERFPWRSGHGKNTHRVIHSQGAMLDGVGNAARSRHGRSCNDEHWAYSFWAEKENNDSTKCCKGKYTGPGESLSVGEVIENSWMSFCHLVYQ